MDDNRSASPSRECPLCGESMRLRTREDVQRIPGAGQEVKRLVREWECPECSYEEEMEDEG